jgi:hypothetical protein
MAKQHHAEQTTDGSEAFITAIMPREPPGERAAPAVRESLAMEVLPPSYRASYSRPPPYSEAPTIRSTSSDILQSTSKMAVQFVVAILFALGHHFFCSSIHGTDASEQRQRWVPIVELILSMLSMFFFCLATLQAYYQNFAVSSRENPMKLRSADVALGLPANPLAIFYWLRQGIYGTQISIISVIYW